MANQILLARSTPIVFSTGGANKNFSIASLANNAGYKSERVDLGAGSTTFKFEWRGYFELNTTVSTVNGGQTIDLFVLTYDGTYADGMLSASTEGSISDPNKRYNLKPIGSVVVDSNSATQFSFSGKFEITSRYFHIVAFNFTGVALSSTQANNGVRVTPIAEEIQ